jgi:isovaleryl-CoA dehydrogenase
LNSTVVFSQRVSRFRQIAREIATNVLAPRAEEVDRDRVWPAHSMRALGDAGLLGVQVPADLGGSGEGLVALAAITEVLGSACASSAICYGMHCTAAAVIAAKPTEWQREHYLRPIAAGRHITTLSLSEPGTGASFYLPETELHPAGDSYLVRGVKHFVTSGNHADSYVVSTRAVDGEHGEFSCVMLDAGTPGMEWTGDWNGLGMRGNSSLTLRLNDAVIPRENLLGEHGDQIWYAFEVVAPFFLTAMAGVYLGIGQAAIDYTIRHVKSRIHSHSGDALASSDLIQHRLGVIWSRLEAARQLLYSAASLGDSADPAALVSILSAKAEIADAAVIVVNEAMTICGGLAYRENDALARMLRDVRASHVMSPTTDMLRLWAGRALVGQPLL